MPKVPPESAVGCLEKGAFGIGENHRKPDGRDLALKLINDGNVTTLFIEFSHTHYGSHLKLAQDKCKKGGASLAEIEKELPESDIPCTTGLRKVVATALMKNLPVHFADDHSMGYKAKEHHTRHTLIATTFMLELSLSSANALAPQAKGCLLLWGGAHFEGDTALDKYIKNLPFAILG